MKTEQDILEVLKNVVDPELAIDIITLGLVRAIEFGDFDGERYEEIRVVMTLTSPLCPFAEAIIQEVEDTVSLLGAGEGVVDLTFVPPWEATPELAMLLGL